VVVIGTTPQGLVYSDPSFSSSLGYGLEIEDVAFLQAWQEASPRLQALAFRPRPSEHGTHQREVEPGEVFARVVATVTLPVVALPTPSAPVATAVEEVPELVSVPVENVSDPSWIILVGAGALLMGGVLFRRWRSPPS
jgi:hypothetical protein